MNVTVVPEQIVVPGAAPIDTPTAKIPLAVNVAAVVVALPPLFVNTASYWFPFCDSFAVNASVGCRLTCAVPDFLDEIKTKRDCAVT